MKLISFALSTEKIAFVNINRQFKNNKSLKDSITSNKKIGAPLLLVNSQMVLDSGLQLVDPSTNEVVTDVETYRYAALDGQHRYKSAMNAINDGISVKDSEYAVLYESAEDLPCEGDIRKSIEDLNISARNWNGADFIYSTNARLKGVELVDVIKKLQECKFSLSTISRALAGNQKTITKQSLSKYEPYDADDSLNGIDFSIGLSIIVFLLEIGFSAKYLRKRYIYDFVYPSGKLYYSRLKSLTMITKKHIESIEADVKSNDEFQRYLEDEQVYILEDGTNNSILDGCNKDWKKNLSDIEKFFIGATTPSVSQNVSDKVVSNGKSSDSDTVSEQNQSVIEEPHTSNNISTGASIDESSSKPENDAYVESEASDNVDDFFESDDTTESPVDIVTSESNDATDYANNEENICNAETDGEVVFSVPQNNTDDSIDDEGVIGDDGIIHEKLF